MRELIRSVLAAGARARRGLRHRAARRHLVADAATRSSASTSRRTCSIRASGRVPDAEFRAADLRNCRRTTPASISSCAASRSRTWPSSMTPIRELARVLAPGGRLIVSVLHPFQALLGWHAPFTGSDGQRGFVREHPHLHTDYLAAFATAGLDLRACVEPEITDRQVTAKRRAFRHIPEATAEAYLGLPAVLCGTRRRLRRRAVRAPASGPRRARRPTT